MGTRYTVDTLTEVAIRVTFETGEGLSAEDAEAIGRSLAVRMLQRAKADRDDCPHTMHYPEIDSPGSAMVSNVVATPAIGRVNAEYVTPPEGA